MPPILPTAALLAALIVPVTASAQVQGGSTAVTPSGGFGCQPGMAWNMGDDGIARCKVVSTQQSLAARSCAGVTGYTTPKALGCTFNVPTAVGGSTSVLNNVNTSTHSGSVTLQCDAGTGQWSATAGACDELPRIISFTSSATQVLAGEALTLTWKTGAASFVALKCEGANPSSNTGVPANGSAAMPTPNAGVTDCILIASSSIGNSAPQSVSWTVRSPNGCAATTAASGSCGFVIAALAHGQSRAFADGTAGFTGSVTATCADGALSYSGATCAADPKKDCAAATATSGSCSFAVPALKHGVSQAVADGTAGFTGSVTATCTDGALSYSGATCAADPKKDCAAATATSGSCSFAVPALKHGVSQAVADGTAGFTGSVTAACSNGALSYSGASCVQDLPVVTVTAPDRVRQGDNFSISWSATNSPTSYSFRGTNVGTQTSWSGTPESLFGATSTGLRSVTVRATNSGGTSAPVTKQIYVAKNCAAVTATSGSCSFAVPALKDGQASATLGDNTAGFTGSVTATCTDGALSYAGATCTQDLPVASVTAPDRVRQGDSFSISWSATNSPTSYSFRGTNVGTQTSWSGTPESLFGATNTGLRSVTVRATNSGGVSAPVTQQIYVAKNCAAVTATSGSCSFPVTALKDGTSQAFATSTAGFDGSVTAACADGTLSYSGASCTPKPGNDPCSPATHQYGSCSFSVAGLKHGQSSAPIPDTTAGFTGRVTATCTNGKLSYSAQSCAADLQPPVLTFALSKTSVFEDETFTATWSGTNSPTRYEFAGVNRGTATSWSGTPKGLGLAVGTHTLTARACNGAGCSAVGSRTVEVKRAVWTGTIGPEVHTFWSASGGYSPYLAATLKEQVFQITGSSTARDNHDLDAVIKSMRDGICAADGGGQSGKAVTVGQVRGFCRLSPTSPGVTAGGFYSEWTITATGIPK